MDATGRLVVLGLMLIVLLAPRAMAQDSTARDAGNATAEASEAAAPKTRAEKAAALVEEIEAGYAKLQALRRQQPEEDTAEGRKLLEQQRSSEEVRIGKLVHELAELVAAAPDDSELEPSRRKLIGWLEDLPRTIGGMLERRYALLDAARMAREEAAPEQQLEVEQQVSKAHAAVDEALRYYADHVPLLEEFGLDASEARADVVERLSARAEELVTRITVFRDDGIQVDKILAASPEDENAKRRSLVLDERLETTIASLRLAGEELRSFGVDTSGYQKLLVEITGNVSDVGLNTSVMTALISDWVDRGRQWLLSGGPRLVVNVLAFLAIIFLAMLLGRFVRRLVERAFRFRGGSASMLLQRTASKLAGQLVFLLGVLVALSQIGISIGPVLAGLGIAGFVVAFALQDTLSNFASGAFILFHRPFDVGDIVEAGGVSGKVLNMTLVTTTILTFDNQTMIVPNKMIWGDVIRNVSAQRTRRVDLTFGIAYDADIAQAERVLQEIVEGDERVLEDPPFTIRLHELADSSVNFIVRPWVNRDDYWDVYWDTIRKVKLRFDEEGIGIPFPQRDVHIHYPKPPEGPSHSPTPPGPARDAESKTDWRAQEASDDGDGEMDAPSST